MRFFDFPIVRFSVFLVFGILASNWFQFETWLILLSIAITGLFVLWTRSKRQLFQNTHFGLATYLCFLCLGAINHQIRLPEYQPSHYLHELPSETAVVMKLEVHSGLKSTARSHRFLVHVRTVNNTSTHGILLIYLRKQKAGPTLEPGDQLLTFAHPEKIPGPLNPGQFDYAKYLHNRDVYRQVYLQPSEIILQQESDNGFIVKVRRLRERLLEQLKTYPFGEDELSILQALTLGHRDSINPELYQSYASAGAIHVLAVSGLHVGILFFILQWILRPLRLIRHGRKTGLILLVITLWGYALLTGLSPSVTRAVTMFSFFGLAQLLNRPTNSINTLFLSFFFLLLWNPKWLFEVGFQLSYLAVFFIIWLHPLFRKIYRPKYYLGRLIWSIMSVSVCAQLGVAPLSIYYFGQFPGLFLLSNLVILPFIGILVGTGLLTVLLSGVNLLPNWLVDVVSLLLRTLNNFVRWTSEQQAFVIKDINLELPVLLCSYLVLLFMVKLLNEFRYSHLRNLLFTIIVFLSSICVAELENKGERMIVFHKSMSSLIGVQSDRKLLIMKCDTNSYSDQFPIKDFRNNEGIRFYSETDLLPVWRFRNKTMLAVDSNSIYPRRGKVDVLLLKDSPRIHLDRLIDSLNPKQVVADGSNYHSYVKRWKRSCLNRKLPFHHTGDSGAFILE